MEIRCGIREKKANRTAVKAACDAVFGIVIGVRIKTNRVFFRSVCVCVFCIEQRGMIRLWAIRLNFVSMVWGYNKRYKIAIFDNEAFHTTSAAHEFEWKCQLLDFKTFGINSFSTERIVLSTTPHSIVINRWQGTKYCDSWQKKRNDEGEDTHIYISIYSQNTKSHDIPSGKRGHENTVLFHSFTFLCIFFQL